MLFLVLGASGGYGYYVYVLDEDTEDSETKKSGDGNSPIARISPSNPKIQVDSNITFSASDSTDLDGDQLSYSWFFEGDSVEYNDIDVVRSYSSEGEFKVTLVVMDSTGLQDETETTVTVVDDYEESFTGIVEEGQTDTYTFPVDSGAVSLRINWSLDEENTVSGTFNPSTVDLTLNDSSGKSIANETDEQDGNGYWEINDSGVLQVSGDYELVIDCTNGEMSYVFDVTVRY